MINVDIKIDPSLEKKLDPEIYQQAIGLTITRTAFEAENRCKNECPVRTGALMRGHSTDIMGSGEQTIGRVSNSMEYAGYVINGTRYQSANNYPERVVNSLESEDYSKNTFLSILEENGLL